MKKNYFFAKAFAIAAIVGIANTASAQYFSDDFTSGMINWTLEDRDGNTPNSNVAGYSQAWNIAPNWDDATDSVAVSNSWYTPAGTANDWMITTNAIDLSGATAPRLKWQAKAQDASYPDGYEVYVVSNLSDITPTVTATPVFTIASENNAWTNRSVDLSSFVGQSIYVAFRNNSTDMFLLGIDDVIVEELPPNPDVTMAADYPLEYSVYPLSQFPAVNIVADGTIENISGLDATGATMTVNVYEINSTSQVYTETSASQTITAGNSANFSVTGYVPSTVGDYYVEFIASITETDDDMTNDTTSYIVQISDSVYARDVANISGVTGIAGLGNGYTGDLGNMFEILVQDTLTSIQAFISNANGAIDGESLVGNVYSWNGSASTLLGSTLPITLSSGNTNTLHELQMDGDVVLAPGQYVIAVHESATDTGMQVGYTGGLYTSGGSLVSADGAIDFTDVNTVFGGAQFAFVVRGVFGTPDITTGIAEINNSGWEVYPNPAVNNISVKNAVIGSTVEIFNNLGQLVHTEVVRSNNVNINIADFDNGVYTIKNSSNKEVTTQSFVKQ